MSGNIRAQARNFKKFYTNNTFNESGQKKEHLNEN